MRSTTSTYEEALERAFSEAAKRKKEAGREGTQSGKSEGKILSWCSEDLGIFAEEVQKPKGNLGDDFLSTIQGRLPT